MGEGPSQSYFMVLWPNDLSPLLPPSRLANLHFRLKRVQISKRGGREEGGIAGGGGSIFVVFLFFLSRGHRMQFAQHSACRGTQKTCVRRQRAQRPAACSLTDFLALLLLPQKQRGFLLCGRKPICWALAGFQFAAEAGRSLGPWAVPGARGFKRFKVKSVEF